MDDHPRLLPDRRWPIPKDYDKRSAMLLERDLKAYETGDVNMFLQVLDDTETWYLNDHSMGWLVLME